MSESKGTPACARLACVYARKFSSLRVRTYVLFLSFDVSSYGQIANVRKVLALERVSTLPPVIGFTQSPSHRHGTIHRAAYPEQTPICTTARTTELYDRISAGHHKPLPWHQTCTISHPARGGTTCEHCKFTFTPNISISTPRAPSPCAITFMGILELIYRLQLPKWKSYTTTNYC